MNDSSSVPPSPATHTVRPWLVMLLAMLVAAAGMGLYWLDLAQPFDTDSPYYTLMAEGRIAEVMKPFTARILQPAVSGFISRTTGLSIDASFFVTNLVCVLVLAGAGIAIILRHVRSVGLALAIVLCPMTLSLFREVYMPDCMHAALVAVFFLLIETTVWWYAVPLLFLMQLTRDSTVLLTFAITLVGAWHRMWKMVIVAILATVLGIFVVGRVASEGRPNIHDQSTIVYLVGKVPFNVLTNICGLKMWTNTHAKNNPQGFPDPPLFQVELPSWMPTGSMRQVGVYSISPEIPLMSFALMLTMFGVMPALVLQVIVWRRWRLLHSDGLTYATQLALLYGVLAFLLGPAIGASMGRLTAYGWPFAWVAAPALLARYFKLNSPLIGLLTTLQLVACWTLLILHQIGLPQVPRDLVSLIVAVVCQVQAWKVLWRNRVLDA